MIDPRQFCLNVFMVLHHAHAAAGWTVSLSILCIWFEYEPTGLIFFTILAAVAFVIIAVQVFAFASWREKMTPKERADAKAKTPLPENPVRNKVAAWEPR